jgi:hypothetical protein
MIRTNTQRRSQLLRGVFAALLMLTAAGCATSPQVSLLETDNRVLKEQNRIQAEELAQLKQERQQLAARAQEAEIELARMEERQTIRR